MLTRREDSERKKKKVNSLQTLMGNSSLSVLPRSSLPSPLCFFSAYLLCFMPRQWKSVQIHYRTHPPKISPLNFCISKVLNNETIGEMIVSLWLRLLELKLSKCFQRRATTTFCYVHVCTCTWLLCIVTEVLSCIISFLIDAAHWIVQLLAESKVLWTPLIWDFCSWSRF